MTFQELYEGLDEAMTSDYSESSYARAKDVINKAYRHVSTADMDTSRLPFWQKEYDMSDATGGALPADYRKMVFYTYSSSGAITTVYEGFENEKYITKYDATNSVWKMYLAPEGTEAIDEGTIRYFYIPAALSSDSDEPAAPSIVHDLILSYAKVIGAIDDGEDDVAIRHLSAEYDNAKDRIVDEYGRGNYGPQRRTRSLTGQAIYRVGDIW